MELNKELTHATLSTKVVLHDTAEKSADTCLPHTPMFPKWFPRMTVPVGWVGALCAHKPNRMRNNVRSMPTTTSGHVEMKQESITQYEVVDKIVMHNSRCVDAAFEIPLET